MDLSEFLRAGFAEHAALLRATEERLAGPFAELVALAAGSLRGGGRLLLFGNGGSAADAQHLATEFTVRFARDRAPLPALALTADTATLTAIGNDYGFERLFARQIEAHGRPGDLAIGLSTSGRSPNVVAGLRAAGALGLGAAALTGGDGGDLPGLARPLLCVPSRVTARIQEMHMLLGHLLCGAVERELGLVEGD
jgi:D-sedoheptulose 7-phosphate isomerase